MSSDPRSTHRYDDDVDTMRKAADDVVDETGRRQDKNNKQGNSKQTKTKYKVSVFTGDKPDAATDANVSINLFGENGESGKRPLDNVLKDDFQRGKKDEFILESYPLGKLHRINIGHDSSSRSPGWFLDKVTVEDLNEKRVYEFPCNRWLDKDKDDGRISRDLPCTPAVNNSRDKTPEEKPVKNPPIKSTDNKDNTHKPTEARDRSKSPSTTRNDQNPVTSRNYDRPDDNTPQRNKERNRSSSPPKNDKDRRDSRSPRAQQERNRSSSPPKHDKNRRDSRSPRAQKERNRSSSPPKRDNNRNTITPRTHTDRNRSSSPPKHDKNRHNSYGPPKIHKTTNRLSSPPADEYTNGRKTYRPEKRSRSKTPPVKSDEKKKSSSTRDDSNTAKKVVFDDHRERSSERNRSASPHEHKKGQSSETGSNNKKSGEATKYKVTVFTGDKQDAGTDANVFINLIGEHGESGKKLLDNKLKDDFQRGKKDEFTVESTSLGKLQRINIGHDNSSRSPEWFLDKVTVEDMTEKRIYEFPCNRWLAKNQDDGKIARDLTCGQGSSEKSKGEQSNGKLQKQTSATKYRVTVFTGDKQDAGTDANVFINLIGEHGESGKKPLDNKLKDDFQRGKKDEFTVESTSLGKLQRINIGHDNSSRSPEWFLDKVTVEDLTEKRVYEFPCNRWLAKNQDDGKIARDLTCGQGSSERSKSEQSNGKPQRQTSDKDKDKREKEEPKNSKHQKHHSDGGRDTSDDDRSRSSSRQRKRRRARSTSPTSRALSARRHKVDDMLQRLNRLNAEMEALRRENRTLRWKQKLAERKLENYEVKESEIPTLVERQAVEMHVLGEQLQKHREKYERKEKQLKETEEEIDKTRRLVDKLKGIVRDKQLEERRDLHRKLTKAEVTLHEKEKAVRSLENYLDNLNKNYKHEVAVERNKFATSRQHLDEHQNKLDRLTQQIQERNKEMQLRNMYADQLTLTPRYPHRLYDSITPKSTRTKTPTSDDNDQNHESDDNARRSRKAILKRVHHPKSNSPRARSVSNGRHSSLSEGRSTPSRSPGVRRSASRSQSRSPEAVTFYDGPSYGSYKPTYTGPSKQRSPRTGRRVQWPRYPVLADSPGRRH